MKNSFQIGILILSRSTNKYKKKKFKILIKTYVITPLLNPHDISCISSTHDCVENSLTSCII